MPQSRPVDHAEHRQGYGGDVQRGADEFQHGTVIGARTLSIDASPGKRTELVLQVPLPPAPSPTVDPAQEQDAHEPDIAGALR